MCGCTLLLPNTIAIPDGAVCTVSLSCWGRREKNREDCAAKQGEIRDAVLEDRERGGAAALRVV